jgi:hypothetical protein
MVSPDLMSHAFLNKVTSLVQICYLKCKVYKGKRSYSEIPFVQQLSMKLISEIATLFDSSFQVYTKASDESKVAYFIEIHNPFYSAEKVFITGQTDEAVYYQETCLLPWEDKHLGFTEFTESDLAQIFSQVKSFAGKFMKD